MYFKKMLYVSIFMSKFCYIFFIIFSIHGKNAIDDINFLDVQRDAKRKSSYSYAEKRSIDDITKEASDMLVNGKSGAQNFTRVATTAERETMVKSMIRTVIIDNAPLSNFCVLRDLTPVHIRHIAAACLVYMAAKIIHEDLAGNFYTIDDVLNKLGECQFTEFNANTPLRDIYNSFTRNTRKDILSDEFPKWYRDVCREKPDVPEQWAVQAGDIEAGKPTGSKKPYVYDTEGNSFDGYYKDGEIIALKKLTARHGDLDENRDFARDVASYEIAQTIGFSSVVRPILYYKGTRGEFTVEKYVAFLPKDAGFTKIGDVIFKFSSPTIRNDQYKVKALGNIAFSLSKNEYSFFDLLNALLYIEPKILFDCEFPKYFSTDTNIADLETFLTFCYLTDQRDMHANNAAIVADANGVIRPVAFDCEDALWSTRGVFYRMPTWLTIIPKFLRQTINNSQ